MKVQRAEVRFGNVARYLRTPAGGSRRQVIIVVDGRKVRSRLISARETARLMGLDESYKLPKNYNEAYHLTGDGVAMHVVRHLRNNSLHPCSASTARRRSPRDRHPLRARSTASRPDRELRRGPENPSPPARQPRARRGQLLKLPDIPRRH